MVINVAGVVDSPTIAAQTLYVVGTPEFFQAVGTVVATDPDPEELLSFEITAGNSDGAYAIDRITGLVSVADADVLDGETESDLTVRVFYGDGLTHDASAMVKVRLGCHAAGHQRRQLHARRA